MNLKTKLSDESIFYKKVQSNIAINRLNSKGIHTVEDFINGDVEKMTTSPRTRKVFRALQKILRYKYLNEPLILDIILEKEYDDKTLECQLSKDLASLGFEVYHPEELAKKYLKKHGTCKMIDLLLTKTIFDVYDTYELRNFYIEYYNAQMKKKKDEKNETSHNIVENKEELEILKNELMVLLDQRDALDIKISSLLEQINTLEGSKNNNARK